MSSLRLGDALQGRDNNWNAIRMAAASLVLVTHSFALVAGTPAAEPLQGVLGMTLGALAVDVFFLASGLLVTHSLLRRHSLLDFAVARCMRIYPGLVAMLVLVVGVLGPLLTTLPLDDYLRHPQTLEYLLRNATLWLGVKHHLPGVFAGNPYPHAVNGSLWTMPYEVRAYAALALLWAIGRTAGPVRTARSMRALVPIVAVLLGTWCLYAKLSHAALPVWSRLIFMFFAGSVAVLMAHRVVLSVRTAACLLTVLVAAGLAGPEAFAALSLLCLPYLVLCAAYLPGGFLRRYNRAPDWSFGVYIYAFPVQQALIACKHAWTVPQHVGWSLLVTLALAALSAHCVELPALSRRSEVAAALRSLVGRMRVT